MASDSLKDKETTNDNCIFCKIVVGDIPNYTVWQNDKHLAFLTPFPNTEGVTVVIPKTHASSYFAEAEEDVVLDLVKAARIVATKIDTAYDDVGRTALVFEGFGVNHLHIKLFPMHKTANKDWEQHISKVDTYFESYAGYISSHDGPQKPAEVLEAIAAKIRG